MKNGSSKILLVILIFIPLIFFDCEGSRDDMSFVIYKSGKCGLINRNGKIILEPQFGEIRHFREGLAAFTSKSVKYPEIGKWGFINIKGEVVIPEIYEGAYEYSEGLASVGKNGKDGYIDAMGNVIIDFKYDSANSFYKGQAIVKNGSKFYLIDKAGNIIKQLSQLLKTKFRDGYTTDHIRVNQDSIWPRLYAYIDTNGEPMTEYRWEYAEDFVDGYGYVSDSEYWKPKDGSSPPPKRIRYFIDKLFKPAFSHLNYIALGSFSEGLAPIGLLDIAWSGFIDTEGKMPFLPKFFKVYGFHDGMAAVQLEYQGKWGFINNKGDLVIKPQWDENEILGRAFENGVNYIRVPGKSCNGYMNKEGKFVYVDCE